MFVNRLRVVPPFRRSPSRGSKKVSGKKIDVSASRGTLEVRHTETAVCKISRDGVRRKGGTAWVKFQVSKELIHKK